MFDEELTGDDGPDEGPHNVAEGGESVTIDE